MKYGNISQTLSDAGIIIIILVDQFSVLWVTELLCENGFCNVWNIAGTKPLLTYICINIYKRAQI